MSGKQRDPVQMRNAILIVGATILVLGVLVEPDIRSLFITLSGILRLVFTAVTGTVIAIGLGHVGETAQRSPLEPWYARPGAGSLMILVCGAIVFGWIALQEFRHRHGKTTSIEDISHLVACIGLGLILITILEWVSYDD